MAPSKLLIPALALAAAALACISPISTQAPVPVATAVAQTLQAFPTPAPSPIPAPSATASPAPDLLPHSLYYLNYDKAGLLQVFRTEADGKTIRQVTFEPAAVGTFDVSPQDGGVAYTSNNQLLLVDASGAGRRTLLDGGPITDTNRLTESVAVPVWSPDGQTLAFAHGGLNFYAMSSGTTTKVLENQIDMTQGFPIVGELYSPNAYSPDGSKLLVNIGMNEAGTFGIYDPSNNALARFTRPDGGLVCCRVDWAPDGSHLYVSSQTLGMFDSGLFAVDAASGKVSTLLPGAASDNTFNFAYSAQVGPDGKLYFFFNNLAAVPGGAHTPLYLVRSDPDGVTGRTDLQANTFDNINEVLWAPDASLAVIADMTASADVYAGGQAEIVYPDGRPTVVLIPFAQQMRWGP